MLELNASARIKDKRGQTALHRAAAVGSLPMVKLLLKEGTGNGNGNGKAFVNARDGDGWTALHHAMAEGNADVAVELVQLGGDLSIVDSEGKSPWQVVIDGKTEDHVRAALK